MQKRTASLARLCLICATVFVLVSVFSVATYAWFTSNKQVQTDVAEIRSGSDSLTLEIASQKDGPYAHEAAITQLNAARVLDPVSTADLTTFFKSIGMQNDQASTFAVTENGYYHGRIFLRAVAEGQSDNAEMKLYIDTNGIVLNDTQAAGDLIHAARVGLVFTMNETRMPPLILSLSQAHIENANSSNTVLPGGTPQGDYVLSGTSVDTITAVQDPAIDSVLYTLQEKNQQIVVPEKSLLTLPLNTVCAVDVYFYIEGCDTDCTNAIRTSEMSIHLPFYGVLTEKGGAE